MINKILHVWYGQFQTRVYGEYRGHDYQVEHTEARARGWEDTFRQPEEPESNEDVQRQTCAR